MNFEQVSRERNRALFQIPLIGWMKKRTVKHNNTKNRSKKLEMHRYHTKMELAYEHIRAGR